MQRKKTVDKIMNAWMVILMLNPYISPNLVYTFTFTCKGHMNKEHDDHKSNAWMSKLNLPCSNIYKIR